MMKRIVACLLAVVCLLTAVAFAEGVTMKVVNVKSNVNLRKGPGTDTKSLGKLPLGTIVTDCVKVEGSDWVAVNYNGTAGYIRGDYLETVATAPAADQPAAVAEGTPLQAESQQGPQVAEGTPLLPTAPQQVSDAPVASVTEASQYEDDFVILDTTAGDVRVVARQIYQTKNEYLMAVGLDASGNELWKQETTTDSITELMQTDAFMAGSQAAPLLLMYNACKGLTAINPADGSVAWTVEKAALDLGGSISHVVDGNGVAYIGGYYGPDPVAIDANGAVLWQASSGKEAATWLYRMELQPDGIACYYGSMASENSGCIVYGFDGAVNNVIYD